MRCLARRKCATQLQHVFVPTRCRQAWPLSHSVCCDPGLLQYNAGVARVSAILCCFVVQVYPENRRLSEEGYLQGREDRFVFSVILVLHGISVHLTAEAACGARYASNAAKDGLERLGAILSCFSDASLDHPIRRRRRAKFRRVVGSCSFFLDTPKLQAFSSYCCACRFLAHQRRMDVPLVLCCCCCL